MSNKQFDAILSKNTLARVLHGIMAGEYANLSELPLNQMRFDLMTIESYIGQGNQPSVQSVIEDGV